MQICLILCLGLIGHNRMEYYCVPSDIAKAEACLDLEDLEHYVAKLDKGQRPNVYEIKGILFIIKKLIVKVKLLNEELEALRGKQ